MTSIEGIIKFNVDRGLTSFNAGVEYRLLEEELHEFLHATAMQDTHEMLDALCDLVVVAVGGIYQLGYNPETALLETVQEVLSRKGAINPDTGKWEKDRTQDLTTLYKADYNKAIRKG